MSKTRLDTEGVLRSIVGNTTEIREDRPAAPEETKPPATTRPNTKAKRERTQAEMLHVGFYISKKQQQALRIRAALREKPEDKDQSAIVRAALDAYLFPSSG